ncbi:MAG: helix-turn-helix transcriptional regulator [Kiritimatiellae bacterium]|jgi:transcriptional regulator with XRE-family HTH domain|nr:helix-turn-helix transcriptional regulator [Kiritimatiellia bacterium]
MFVIDESAVIIYDNTMNEQPTISEQLRSRRQEIGLSLSELARRARTSAATLSRYENNWSRFEVYTLRKLALALDCDLELSFRPRVKRKVPSLSREELASRLGRLFWDHKLTAYDLDLHPVWVVERVLEYGNLDDVALLRETMGQKAFLAAVASTNRLSPRTQIFWNHMLAMEGVKCTKKYSRNTAWNC